MKFNIDISELSNKRQAKARLVIKEMNIVINSDNFKYTLAAWLESHDMYQELSRFRYASSNEIYKHLMSGAETLSPEIDYEVDMKVLSYFSWRHVVGYTYPSVKWIKVNTRYFDRNSTKYIGSNFLHEYFHKLGGKHVFRHIDNTASICYILNHVYEDTYDQLFKKVTNVKTILS